MKTMQVRAEITLWQWPKTTSSYEGQKGENDPPQRHQLILKSDFFLQFLSLLCLS